MKTKRILSIALTLVMLLGMLPGMSLTAMAAGNTTTITPGTDDAKTGTGTMTITLIIKGNPVATDFDVTLPTSLAYDGTAKTASAAAKSTVTGMGTITVEYYKGGTKVDSAVEVGDYTVKLKVADDGTHYNAGTVENADWKFSITKGTPSVTAPKAKENLTYTGSAQALVNAGTATGGEMRYAIGKDATTAPSDGWSASIPTGTNAGTYYVWYKAVGDDTHTDSEPASVTVTVSEAEEIEHYKEVPLTTGEVKDITGTEEAPAETNPYGTKIVNSESLVTLLKVTDTEKAAGVNVWLEVQDGTATVPETDKAKILSTAGDYAVGQYLDVNLFKKVGNNDPVKVSEPNGKVKVSIVIPASLRKDGRTFRILKVHNGEPSVIDGTYDASTGIFTFETDSFSSYAIAYKDGEEEDDDDDDDDDEPAQTTAATSTTPRAPKTGDSMMSYSFWLMLAAAGLAVSGMAAKGRKEQE